MGESLTQRRRVRDEGLRVGGERCPDLLGVKGL